MLDVSLHDSELESLFFSTHNHPCLPQLLLLTRLPQLLEPNTGMSNTVPRLFTPVAVGDITLQHRVVLAPLTRLRADDNHVHTHLGVEHYAQRAAVRGTLLITEATFIAPQAGGYHNVPGIWNDEQIAAWKSVSISSPANVGIVLKRVFPTFR